MNDGCEICRRRSAAVFTLGKHVICATCAAAIGRHFQAAPPSPAEREGAIVRALAHAEGGQLSEAADLAAIALAHGAKLEAHQTLQALAIVLHPKVRGCSLAKTIEALRTSLYRD